MNPDALRRQLAVADEVRERLYEYGVDDDRFTVYRRDAWIIFFGPLVPPGQLPDDHPDWDAFDDWFLFDFRLNDGKTPFQRFLLEESPNLKGAERALAQRWHDDVFGVFAVVGTTDGATLEHLGTKRRYLTPNVRLTRRGAKWDHLIGRLTPVADGAWGFTTEPRRLLPALTAQLPADFTGAEPPAADPRARSVEFWRVVRRLAAEHPTVPVTDEGDPVRPARARYSVADLTAARAALDRLPFLAYNQAAKSLGYWYDWRGKPPGWAGPTIDLGAVRLVKDTLTIECLSPERLARARGLLEPALAGLVTLQAEEIGAAPTPIVSAEDEARGDNARRALGALLQATSRDERREALVHAAPGSEAAVLLEHFATEPLALLAGLHHAGAVAVQRTLLSVAHAAVEFAHEADGAAPVVVSALLRAGPTGFLVERIRPGRIEQRPSDAIGDDPVLIALWTGDWQWAPTGPVADHPVLGIALARLHRTGRPILQQAMAIRLWDDFRARSAAGQDDDAESWAIALEAVSNWLAGRSTAPTDARATAIISALALVDEDRRYAIDQSCAPDALLDVNDPR